VVLAVELELALPPTPLFAPLEPVPPLPPKALVDDVALPALLLTVAFAVAFPPVPFVPGAPF
jgi:hypothetical protein